jgi:hypothetical protein
MDELEYLRRENERLRKALDDKQQVASPRSFLEDHEFITDCCRYAEGILSKQDVKKKYHFDDATWARLGEDEALIEAIELEKVRRVRSGAAKREKSQLLVTKAPDILDSIMSDVSASPKHRIDASKTLDAFAANGSQATPAGDRFQITIVLSADEKIRIDKPIAPGADDGEIIDNTELLPMIAANKEEDGSSGGVI